MIFLVPYAYDRMPDGKPRKGVPANRLGSKARCDILLKTFPGKLAEEKTTLYWFVFSAGYSKQSPDSPTTVSLHSIAEEMAKYIELQGGVPYIIISRRLSWGTYEETKSSIYAIRNVDAARNTIFISTNLGHMPRVMLCWFFLKPKGWKVRFVCAKHSFTFWPEYFQETAKFFQYLYKFLFRKW